MEQPSQPESKPIAERLRTACLAANKTQQEVAGGHFSKNYISAIERGKMTPSVQALEYLAGRLQVPLGRTYWAKSNWTSLPRLLPLSRNRSKPRKRRQPSSCSRRRSRHTLAQLKEQQGNATGAEQAYSEALTLLEGDPFHDEARTRYSQWLAAAGRYEDAIRLLQATAKPCSPQ